MIMNSALFAVWFLLNVLTSVADDISNDIIENDNYMETYSSYHYQGSYSMQSHLSDGSAVRFSSKSNYRSRCGKGKGKGGKGGGKTSGKAGKGNYNYYMDAYAVGGDDTSTTTTATDCNSYMPSDQPSLLPSSNPSIEPSVKPTPSFRPSTNLTVVPSTLPSITPSMSPTLSVAPSVMPSQQPSTSVTPSMSPTGDSTPLLATISMELKTDGNGDEISYELMSNHGEMLWSRSGLASDTMYQESIVVNAFGCYTFTIRDSGSNGICCFQGNGYGRLYYNGGDPVRTFWRFAGEESESVGEDCP